MPTPVEEKSKIAELLQHYIARSKKTQRQIADEIGMEESYISKMATGVVNWTTSRKYFVPLAQALKLSPDEIQAINPAAVFTLPVSTISDKKTPGQGSVTLEFQHGVTMKDVYDLAQATKPIEDMEPDRSVSPIPILVSDLYPGTLLFRVRGHSMTIPSGEGIEDGDIIFVDTHDVDIRLNETYVIYIPGSGVTLKRVRQLGGQLWLFSDNPDQTQYPPFQVDEANIIGRVHFGFRPLSQFQRRAR